MAMVLVVEDHADVAAALKRILDSVGFKAAVVDNGKAALELMNRKRPAAVILDYNLPEMSGADILRQMKADERTNAIPVIMCTADMSYATKDEALRLGAVEFLVKGTVAWMTIAKIVKKYTGHPAKG